MVRDFNSLVVMLLASLQLAKACTNPLGMESGAIEDSQIFIGDNIGSERKESVRYNHPEGWYTKKYPHEGFTENGYIQIDLKVDHTVSAILLQRGGGRHRDYSYGKKVKIQWKPGGIGSFGYYKDKDGSELKLNQTRLEERINFEPPLCARYLRIMPYLGQDHLCMRLEVLGCTQCLGAPASSTHTKTAATTAKVSSVRPTQQPTSDASTDTRKDTPNVKKSSILSIPNIQPETAPFQGKTFGKIIEMSKEIRNVTYGIQWVHSKILRKNVSETNGFAGRDCAEAEKVAAPLSYICVDPNTGEIKATSEFKYMPGETLTVKVYAIDRGDPRQYSTLVFEININDFCKRAQAKYKHLSTSCMGNKDRYIVAYRNGSTVLYLRNGDRVVRIGINRNEIKFPTDTELVRFTLKQVLNRTTRKYGRQVSVVYNNTAHNLQNKSDVQLPLVLSFDGSFAVELFAESYYRNSTALASYTLDGSGIRLYVHSFEETCGSTECVTMYKSWVDDSQNCRLDASKADPLYVHQYYRICLDPPTVLLHPMSTSVPMNSVIRLYCTYRNYTAVEFQLIKDGEVFDSANYIRKASRQSSPAQEFMIHGTEPDWQGYFHCMVKDALNHTVNSTKTLVRFTDVSTSKMELKINQPFSKALQNKASPQYKKLSDDVANTLQNMLDRNNMHKHRKIVIREFRPGSVVASVSIYYINVTDQGRRILCNQFQSLPMSMSDTNLDISSVDIVSFDCCYKEQTGEKNIKGVITWNPILADSFDEQACPYGPSENKWNITVKKASRLCQPNFTDGAQWQDPNIAECAYKTRTTSELEKISQANITDDNLKQIAEKLDDITSNEENITNRLDVKFTADTIENLVNTNKNLSKITKNIIAATSNMMDFDETYVAESQNIYRSSSKVLGSLDKLAIQLQLLPNATINAVSKNLAFALMPIERVNEGIAVSSERDQESGYNNVTLRKGNMHRDELSLSVIAHIWLPKLLLEKAAYMNQKSFNRIYSFVYENTQLFKTKEQIENILSSSTGQIALGFSKKINSRILSASIGKLKLENLSVHEEMQGSFRLLSRSPFEVKCVYWDVVGDGFGSWSSDGCRPVGMTSSIQKCRCNHLTSFAILLDVTGKGTPPEAATALSIITYVGCAISLVCLLMTLITFAIFRKLRQKRPARILMSLCSALVLTIIAFLAGIQANDKTGCQVFAVLIHYLVLVSFLWMAVEGFNLYLCFVRIGKDSISRFMLKSNVFAWGTPIIIVAISAAVTKLESYGKKSRSDEWVCIVTGTAFYVAYLLPILLIATINLVIMGFVIKSLKSSNQVSKDRRMTGLTIARIGAACSVLMGTTWIIGLFAVDVLTIPMQMLFCIFNSLQGFFIFIFYCARNKDAKKRWMDTLWSRDTEDSKSRTLGGNRYKVDKASLGADQNLIASTNF